jgi:hypothetical protein
MVQFKIPKALWQKQLLRGAMQQDCEKLLSLARQLPTTASIFKHYV